MLIYRPIKTKVLTQDFGESKACVRLGVDKRPIQPFQVKGKRGGVCPQGWTDFYNAIGMEAHNGKDNATWYKEPAFFPVMAECEWIADTERDADDGIGLDVYSQTRIKIDVLPEEAGPQATQDWFDNDGFMYVKFRSWHAESNLVTDGQLITFGQKTQLCDSTGASSGNHMHWSMKFVNSQRNTLDRYNGYYGAVDFKHWYIDTFVLDLQMKDAPKLTTVEIIKSMARTILSSDWKLSKILNSIAQMVEAFGGMFKTKRSASKLTFKQ